MKKIGILTFHRAYNCGAIMQTFALQYIISKLGGEPTIIDYLSAAKRENTKLLSFKYKTLKNILTDFVFDMYRFSKKKKFDRFIKTYIPITQQSYCSKEQLIEMDEHNFFDLYIVGSDQVWNPGNTMDDDAYMLSFVGKTHKRNSYAASLGSAELTDEQIQKLKYNLADFNIVTVREKNSLEKYPFLSDYGTNVVLDPTLLLTKEDYSVIKRKRLCKNYAFIYTVGKADKLRKYAQQICRERGLKLIDCKKSARFFIHSSPEDFLSFVENADIVFTNSFHGTAFSVIFEKKFVTEVNLKGGFNNRSDDLLNLLNIHDRDIGDPAFDIDAPIDWEGVNEIRKIEVNRSIEALKRMINT